MVGEACLPSNAYYPRTPYYTLHSGVHVCWSEHSDSSFIYGFMSLDYGLGTMTATTSAPASDLRFTVNPLCQNLFKLSGLHGAWESAQYKVVAPGVSKKKKQKKKRWQHLRSSMGDIIIW